MYINLKRKDNIYEQIINEYKKYIELNIIKKDEKLPSCRALANELGINPNTVFKAYNVLEELGYIKILPKKGVYVIYEQGIENFDLIVKEAIIELKNKNITYETVIKIVNEIYGGAKK